MERANQVYSSFVPRESLTFLQCDNILDVPLGDQVQTEMCVLFSDIIAFTSLSEKLAPEYSFRFISAYLSWNSPVVRMKKGFIDKYTGDSIMALFRVDFTGRGELQVRQSTLNGYLNMMQKTAEEYNVAVFVTNQVMSDPGGGMTFVADPKRPVGGHVLNHACTTRIMLRKGKGEQRIAKLIDSPSCPESDAIFALANRGVIDAAD